MNAPTPPSGQAGHPGEPSQAGQAGQAQPEQKPEQKKSRSIIEAAKVLFGVIILAGFAFYILQDRLDGGIEVGDCIVGENDATEKKCDSDKSTLKVYGLPGDTPELECSRTPGADAVLTSYDSEGTTHYCVGAKDNDPATSINGVEPGQCVRVPEDEEQAVIVQCGEPGAREVTDIREGTFTSGPRAPSEGDEAPCKDGEEFLLFGISSGVLEFPRALCLKPAA